MPRISDKDRIARYKSLNLTTEEERELCEYDKAVDSGKETDFDLTPEQQKVAQFYTRTGTRKAPTVYNFSKRDRKENATKAGIIAELDDFLRHGSKFEISEVNVTNKERQIAFRIGNDNFELTLVQKRKKG